MALARPELPYKGWNERVIREACNHLRVGFEQELHKIRGIWYWVIFRDVPAPWYWVDFQWHQPHRLARRDRSDNR